MIRCEFFSRILKKYGFVFFTGVPDSTIKSWISYLEEGNTEFKNIISVNECEAAAICAGYHLSTGRIGVLYMQNDGFGKTVNPLTSLCNPEVYGIPILLLIGWRGEPGKKDACQHHKMGEILIPLLDLLGIPYEIVPSDIRKVDNIIKKAQKYMQENNKPFALIVRKNIFEKSSGKKINDLCGIGREEALKTILKYLNGDEIIVSTTGKLTRELFEYRVENNERFNHDFYNVGAMGCAQSIGLGIALQRKNKQVFVFDGDGSILMQMGGIATIGYYSPKNFYHIIFDNKAHDSTGGQPTCSESVDFMNVALACKYNFVKTVKKKKELEKIIKNLKNLSGPAMIVVEVRKGARDNLGRPNKILIDYKRDFMKYVPEQK